MGDGILAVFGDPVPTPDHARRAVEVALAMQERVAQLRERWQQRFGVELAIRIGIATGEVFVGNIGSRAAKIEYTAIGPPVNLAARLEGQSPPGGVLVCRQTRTGCGEAFLFEEVPPLTVKGFAEPQQAFLAARSEDAPRAVAG
ncbi:MAG: adenylate/guanylate cyclase domain-containing protein, partial [Myxococcales bacterium]